ncbi:MAG TPA: S8 family serine peptidase, partial [Phototrophicaceae bacterium]|nr:S8 family serine peptidase [Phototrophicaceae bacterium]
MNRKLVVLPIVIGTIGLLVFAVILAGRVPTAPQIAEIPTLMVLPSLTHPPKIAATLAQSTSTPVPNTTEEPTGDLSTPVSEQPLALIEHWAAPTTTPVTFKSQTAPIALPIPPEPVANQVVITFNPAASAQERQTYISQLGGTVIQEVTALNSVVITVPETVTNQPLPISPAIAASEPDYWVAALVVEANDSLYDQQWSLPVIGATDGWAQLPDNAPAVTIAVIDSGVCADHPDLSGRILPGYDFVSNDDTPQDDFGHGCSVTGIIAANTGNTEGIAGIAPNAQILPLRVLDERGLGTYSNVAAAIVYATDHGAQIINLSLGGSNSSTVLQNAVNYAVSKGVLVIAAAGNTGGAVLYPAAYDAVIAVTAVDSDLQRSSFSSFGPQVDLLAPGRDILTTTRDGSYRLMTGTSFAAPEAAGIAALQLAFGNSLTLGGGLLRFTPDSQPPTPTPPDNDTGTPEPTAPSVPVMRNPAAVYCLDLGYQYETVPGIGGGEDGMCIFPDGQRCEQWQFYAGQCGQQYSYCAQQGLGIVTLEDGKDPFSPVYAACTDTSGQVIGSVNELSSLGSRALGCYDGKCPEPSSESASLGTAVDPAEDWVSGLSVPTAFDWRSYQGGNWLTGVRNQGGCGSCWAFAAVGAAEAALEIGAENSYLEP